MTHVLNVNEHSVRILSQLALHIRFILSMTNKGLSNFEVFTLSRFFGGWFVCLFVLFKCEADEHNANRRTSFLRISIYTNTGTNKLEVKCSFFY